MSSLGWSKKWGVSLFFGKRVDGPGVPLFSAREKENVDILGQSSSDNAHEVTRASLIPHIQALVDPRQLRT
jgi:hypothetical protein